MSTKQDLDRSSFQRPVYRRASRACVQCRERKIKCDLTEKGSPCQNCQNDEVECTTSISRRSRKYRLNMIHSRASQPTLSPTDQALPVATTLSFAPAIKTPHVTLTQQNRPERDTASPSLENSIIQSSPEQLSYSQQKKVVSVSTPGTSFTTQPSLGAGSPSSYITTTKRRWKADELKFLNSQGALSVPDLTLRDHLLLSCVVHSIPFLPVLDVQDFLDAVTGESNKQVSLILFQAVMFAGTVFADLQVLLDAGFKSRIEARAYFYQKVKLLYDFEWESDRIVLIQTILLCSYWYVTGNDQKDPWYWLGICKSLAISLGLNRESTYVEKDSKTSQLWRRIWWTCVSRDRITSITTRKPIQIKDEEINVLALSFSDFDTKPITTKIMTFRESPAVADCVSKMMLADMFMSKIKLLMATGKMLDGVYILQSFAGSPSDWATFYMPKRRQDLDPERIYQLQTEFDHCSSTLNDYCCLSYNDHGMNREISKILRVHRASLELLRLSAQEALHRPLAYSEFRSPHSSNLDSTMDKSRTIVRETATKISNLVRAFREESLLGHIPPLSLGCILSAVISHLAEIKVTKKMPSDSPDHPVHKCIEGLLSLQEVWPIAEGTIQLVRQMIASSQIAYAWNFRMLSRPIESHRLSNNCQQRTRYGEAELSMHALTSDLDSRSSHDVFLDSSLVYGTEPIDMNFAVSPYLALMHPFPGIASNASFYNAFQSSGCNIFSDPTVNSNDPNRAFGTNLTGDCSSLGSITQETPNISASLLSETWNSSPPRSW